MPCESINVYLWDKGQKRWADKMTLSGHVTMPQFLCDGCSAQGPILGDNQLTWLHKDLKVFPFLDQNSCMKMLYAYKPTCCTSHTKSINQSSLAPFSHKSCWNHLNYVTLLNKEETLMRYQHVYHSGELLQQLHLCGHQIYLSNLSVILRLNIT